MSLLPALVERLPNCCLWGQVDRSCFLDFERLANGAHEVLSTPASDQAGQSPNATLVATSPLLASVAAKSKERKQSRHRVRKNSRSKKGEASPMSTSNSRSSREYSTMLEDSRRETSFNQQSYAQDQMHPEGGPVPGSQQPTYGQYATPPYPTMQSPTQGPQTSGIYQTDQTFNNPYSYQMASSQQQQACHSVAYSSKIEDIARAPSAQQDGTDRDQPYVRSQYITARHESVWRETR
jgi:hypothetical protein